MNGVHLVGNLSTDVSTRKVGADNKLVASFFLAVNRPGRDAGADFIPVSTWNGSAEACSKYLTKGKKVAVTGSIRTRRYEIDGETRYGWEVSASRVEFLSPSSSANQDDVPTAVEPSTPAPSDDDIPF